MEKIAAIVLTFLFIFLKIKKKCFSFMIRIFSSIEFSSAVHTLELATDNF